jgi:hypothetical protein
MNTPYQAATTRSTAPGDTAFSQTLPISHVLQTCDQTLVHHHCQRCETQGMNYLLYTVDSPGAGKGLFPKGAQFHGPVRCMASTGLDPQRLLRIYFTDVD